MLLPKTIRELLGKMAAKARDVEFSEELTNAYFGNQEAWQVPPINSTPDTNKEP